MRKDKKPDGFVQDLLLLKKKYMKELDFSRQCYEQAKNKLFNLDIALGCVLSLGYVLNNAKTTSSGRKKQ